jgi:hypothetical protein
MKSRYDGIKGKEAGLANQRQNHYESVHNANNEFVKKQQAMTASMGGKMPNLTKEYQNFDACMVNDGMHAQDFGRKLASPLDKKAFPVK